MMRFPAKFNITVLLVGLSLSSLSAAQQPDLAELRRNIDLFSGVIEEALGLQQGSGFLGLNRGEVRATYLQEQGIVLQVRTPLASRRNRLSLAQLSSTIQALPRTNPFEEISRRASQTATLQTDAAAATSASGASDYYSDMMENIASIDYSLVVNSALQEAAEAGRSLRSMGFMDELNYAALRDELGQIRSQLEQDLDNLRSAATAQQTENTSTAATAEEPLLMDEIVRSIESLRISAVQKAEELQERQAMAEQQYAASWQSEVAELEQTLYTTMCDFSSTFRTLPESNKVTVILVDLGEATQAYPSPDKIHIFDREDLLGCQAGNIDAAELRDLSVSYSY